MLFSHVVITVYACIRLLRVAYFNKDQSIKINTKKSGLHCSLHNVRNSSEHRPVCGCCGLLHCGLKK